VLGNLIIQVLELFLMLLSLLIQAILMLLGKSLDDALEAMNPFNFLSLPANDATHRPSFVECPAQ
jgi:hypothetical protein